jgi:TonB-linked SusC/RagA family outer membrane protein
MGMITLEQQVEGETIINVQLDSNQETLDEVVITALGIKREAKSLSYSRQAADVSTITEAPTTNIVSSLSGKVAGVNITPPSTNTGSARVVIRGNNSITGNNQPLFVIDGIPVDNETGDANVTTTGNSSLDYGNIAANINPEDIASIEVLKGPNAAALYGSRAANGVILITTKSSAGNGFRVTLNSNTTFQRIREFPDYQNMFGAGSSFNINGSGSTNNPEGIPDMRVFNRSWGAPFLGQPVIGINGDIRPYLPQPDNVKEFYKTATLLTNSIAVEGGGSENNYRFSYTNFLGGSIVSGINENQRNNVNLRIFNTFNNWLTLDSKLTYINNTVKNRQYMNGSNLNPVYQYAYMVRDVPLDEFRLYKDAEGNEINTHRNFLNPFWAINENPNEDTKNQILGAFNLNAQINDWLRFTAKIGAEMYWLDGYTFNNIGAQSNPNGEMSTFNNSLESINADLILFANNQFGNVSMDSFVGIARFQRTNRRNRQEINSLIQPGLINLSNSSEFPNVNQFSAKKIINSAYASLSLGYQDYIFLDATARNDWSSTLPAANNSYFYPSIGGTLVFTDAFNLNNDFLTFGKVRASYAIVGNDTDPYQLIPTYSFEGIYNDQAYAELSSTFFNPDLKPEKTSSFEYGADFRFLKNRLNLGLTFYESSTTNQIVTAQITPTSGFTDRYYNAGEIANWGTEISLSGALVRSEDFSWNVILNYAKNNSEVKSLVEGIDRFRLNSWFGRANVFAEVGSPYGAIYGRGWKRDDQGRKLVDEAGEPLTETDQYLGNANPDWTGGISNSFKYRNVDLGFLVDIRSGGEFYSGTFRRMHIAGNSASTIRGREDYYLHSYIYGESRANLRGGFIWEDAYFEDGTPNNKYISPQSNDFSQLDEEQIMDASYVKLREVVLGYNVPASFLSKVFVTNARISISGRNLWTFYKNTPRGIDPEASVTSGNGQGIEYGSLPPQATYGLDLKLTF